MTRSASPYEVAAQLERAIAAIVRRGYLEQLARVPVAVATTAVAENRPRQLFSSPVWRRSVGRLLRGVTTILTRVGLIGGRGANAEMPVRSRQEVGTVFASGVASPIAISFVQGLDAASRRAAEYLVAEASEAYRQKPTQSILRRLARDLLPLLGLTERQARRMLARAAAIESSHGAAAAAEYRQGETVRLREVRAAAFGDRAVVETLSAARHGTWLEALRDGRLPAGTMRQWRDQGDERVRPNHRRQSQAGPIPIDGVYEIMGVAHPPSTEFGCRCWEVLVFPD